MYMDKVRDCSHKSTPEHRNYPCDGLVAFPPLLRTKLCQVVLLVKDQRYIEGFDSDNLLWS